MGNYATFTNDIRVVSPVGNLFHIELEGNKGYKITLL